MIYDYYNTFCDLENIQTLMNAQQEHPGVPSAVQIMWAALHVAAIPDTFWHPIDDPVMVSPIFQKYFEGVRWGVALNLVIF